MGAEQSRQNKNSKADKNPDLEQSLEVKENQCEIILMKKLLELEIDAKYFREKIKHLDTQVGVLKVENTYLKGYVDLLAGKVESFQNEKEDFESKIKQSECKTRLYGSVPPFKENQAFLNPTSSSQIFPRSPFSSALIESSSNDVSTNKLDTITTTTSDILKPQYSQGRSVDKKLCPNPLSLLHYDHPLPPEMTSLCQVDWCGLCQLRLATQIMANEHYWGRKHFKVVEDYLENVFSETSELKPRYKPSPTYNRPLPLAVISQCTPSECHLCNLSFADGIYAAQEHYYGQQHDKQVLKFLQKNPEHWQEGFRTTSKRRKRKKHAKKVQQLQNLPEDGILTLSDDIISCDDQVILSDNTKEVITLSEDCDDTAALDSGGRG